MVKSRDIVIGMGEIGANIAKLLRRVVPVTGMDLMSERGINSNLDLPVELIHICIPYSNSFVEDVLNYVTEFQPKALVIHSTVAPHTTERLQTKLKVPIIFSPVRGVHSRMLRDLKRYTKFYSYYRRDSNDRNAEIYRRRLRAANVKYRFVSTPLALELAKILVDTTYYGWLITYAQITNQICLKAKINYDEMWEFADEIHKYLGNRPKMYPGFIGGHCVIPNIRLLNNEEFNWIIDQNEEYKKILDNLANIVIRSSGTPSAHT